MFKLPYDITCGYFDCSEFGSLSRSPKRKVLKYEIEFYLEDGLSAFADGKEYKISKWHIQIAKPGQIRYTYLPFKTLYIKFRADGELAELLNNAPEYFRTSHPQLITDKLKEIIQLSENKDNDLLFYSRILSLLNLVLDDSLIPENLSFSYHAVSAAKRFIEERYSESIQLSDIAAAVNLSPVYFHNIFTGATGISPHDYLIQCRISAAKRLLWDTGYSMDRIAEECGFGCQQYLSKIFKKETGITPGKYRKEFQQNYMEEYK